MRDPDNDDESRGTAADSGAPPVADASQDSDNETAPPERSPFPHPPWTVGLVLVAGVITLAFGILVSPIWLVVGSPFVIVLILWLWIRLVVRPNDGA